MRILFILFTCISIASHCQIIKAVDNYMAAQHKYNRFSGVVRITKGGKILYRKAFGLANQEWQIPNTPSTRFRIASITKQFTATAILQLVAAGKLSLNDPLSKYYPDFPLGETVTIQMLLNHTSGIKSFTRLSNFRDLETISLSRDSILSLFRNEPYDFKPGTRFLYNNSAYFLLGGIIEQVSEMTYENYVKRNFLKRLGMTASAVDETDTIIHEMASGYRRSGSEWKKAKYMSMEFPFAGGTMVSNVDDLYTWQRALFGKSLLPDSLFNKMTTPGLGRYGYGLDVDSLQGHLRIGHDGNNTGYASYCYYYSKDDLSIIVLSNRQGSIQWLGQALAGLMLGLEVVTPYEHKQISLVSDLVGRYTGKYMTPEKSTIELVAKGGRLYRRNGNTDVEILPESPTKFYWTNGTDTQLLFQDTTGAKAFLVRDGLVSPLKKVD
jgi:CubicO group peptidase (beta-lactamase class C family)